jgi:hypothetical protein
LQPEYRSKPAVACGMANYGEALSALTDCVKESYRVNPPAAVGRFARGHAQANRGTGGARKAGIKFDAGGLKVYNELSRLNTTFN